jgi:hypothetical protein
MKKRRSGDVLEPARLLAPQDLPAQLLLQGALDRTHIELAHAGVSVDSAGRGCHSDACTLSVSDLDGER